MKLNPAARFSFLAILALAIAILTGCATPAPVDWNSRVGNYTYDQAITELGRPDRQAKLSDGKTLYKWYVRPNVGSGPNTGMSHYGDTGFSTSQTAGSSNNHMLQLTFGPDGKLAAWSQNY